MSQPEVDPEFMAEIAGYERGQFEARSELSFKIKEVLNEFLTTHKLSSSCMADKIRVILDGK